MGVFAPLYNNEQCVRKLQILVAQILSWVDPASRVALLLLHHHHRRRLFLLLIILLLFFLLLLPPSRGIPACARPFKRSYLLPQHFAPSQNWVLFFIFLWELVTVPRTSGTKWPQ